MVKEILVSKFSLELTVKPKKLALIKQRLNNVIQNINDE